eukprot:93688_1
MDVFTAVISGYIHIHLDVLAPSDVIDMIVSYAQGRDGILCVKSNEIKVLDGDREYEFTSVIIHNGGVLSVTECSDDVHVLQHGGTLLIESMTYFTIKKGGIIQLDNKGYKGGKGNGWSGGTYKKPPVYHRQNKPGGGGGGGWTAYGGGGGYGTTGSRSTFSTQLGDNGGGVYGDELLTVLHLGSGGGSCTGAGGNGGGALRIRAVQFINHGQITANGGAPEKHNDGGGSGGSIHITCQHFEMDNDSKETCFIHALGGENVFEADSHGKGGSGGDGRIRIDCQHTSRLRKCVTQQIKPTPFPFNCESNLK